MLSAGNNHTYSLLYQFPYLNRKKIIGMGAEAAVSRDREVPLMTVGDKIRFLRDDSFLTRGYLLSLNVIFRPDI